MDEDYAPPRDVHADLVEITTRLGEPDATHQTRAGNVAWRLLLGVLLVVVAAGLHFALWSGLVPWPKGAMVWKGLVAAMLIGPGFGIYLIIFALRGRRLWVLTYPNGLFVWHRGRVLAFPWDEVQAVQIAGLPQKAVVNYQSDAVWYDLSRSGRRVLGTTITLTRADGEQIDLRSTLGDYADLGRRVQEETYRRLYSPAWADFQAGRPLVFGTVICSLAGVTIGKETLAWADVESLVRARDKLEVKKIGKKKAWATCGLNDLVNPHVLMGLVAAVRSG